ncbi:MAG: TatD family hydrolase [Ferruginibacter sp.]
MAALTDTHCHLYLDAFRQDIRAVMERAREAGVTRFFLPAISSAETADLLALEAAYPQQCFAMMGLHPCSVNAGYREELEAVKNWLAQRSFAAVGEIGLDFYWDKTYIREQYEAFETQIEWALGAGLPVVIHSREAMQECIDMIRKYSVRGLRGIFHCFGGSFQQARDIIDAGFYLGIGGVLTYKKSGLAEVLKDIPLQHLVLETDAPYLTPVPFRGKRNESSYLTYVAAELARVKNTSLEEVGAVTSNNAEKIFGR